ncbi:hypothetical protein BM533_19300 [Clostridioides difficile]|nr:hypothetical protein BM533_19300 [Clostridioides difficile]
MMFDTPANENNVYAQHMVGLIYDMFYKDYVNSKFWYEKARAQGCVESIYNLGQIYLKIKMMTQKLRNIIKKVLNMEVRSVSICLQAFIIKRA